MLLLSRQVKLCRGSWHSLSNSACIYSAGTLNGTCIACRPPPPPPVLLQVADAATLSTLHNSEGCTLQVHQPQRFFDPCWRLLAALERELGCLVGTNA